MGKFEQVLESVLKLVADADDGKEVEAADDDVESVEPDVDEADGNDEAEHCVAGPPKVPKHCHTVLGSNIDCQGKQHTTWGGSAVSELLWLRASRETKFL